MQRTPASLLERLRSSSEPRAWDDFVNLYTPLLYRWARRATLEDADAADLVQEVFVILLGKLPQFDYDPTKGFRNWLRTVTLNKWREFQRRRQVLPQKNNRSDAIDEIPAPAAEQPFWEVEYRQMLVRRLLETMQTEFQPSTWKACYATAVEGRPIAEVAKELGLSAGAVRAAKFRVLCRLRSELQGLLD